MRILARAAFMVLVLVVNNGNATEPGEVIMACHGNIHAIGEVRWDRENEMIAAHVANGKMSLSGNDFFLGPEILICSSATLGLPDDILFFDTSGCGTGVKSNRRTYGTFNEVLRTLDVSYTEQNSIISGRFKCEKR